MTPDEARIGLSGALWRAGGLLAAPALADASAVEVAYDPHARPRFSMLDEMFVERGSMADWEALHHLHYKAEGLPLGPAYWRLTLRGETIGVVLLSLPRPLLKERHKIWPHLKPRAEDRLSNTARYKWINDNIRVASRVVVDSMWRGCGASYRFLNLAARMSGWRFVELQSAMSKYNLFAQRAGFKFVKPVRSNSFESGMKMIRSVLAAHPADIDAMVEELAAMPPAQRAAARMAIADWYRRNSSMEQTSHSSDAKRVKDRQGAILERITGLSDRALLHNFQQLVMASPLYSVWSNPDWGRTDMPALLPLRAFDNQPPDKPLDLGFFA